LATSGVKLNTEQQTPKPNTATCTPTVYAVLGPPINTASDGILGQSSDRAPIQTQATDLWGDIYLNFSGEFRAQTQKPPKSSDKAIY
jgi:hypothetical protein